MLYGMMIAELSFTHSIADGIARLAHTHADRRILVLKLFVLTFGIFETFWIWLCHHQPFNSRAQISKLSLLLLILHKRFYLEEWTSQGFQQYIPVVFVTVETSCPERETWLRKQLFSLQEAASDFKYLLLLVRNIGLVMSVSILICQTVNN